jgi:twitching motility protein PilT
MAADPRLISLIETVIAQGGSDLHISAGEPPMIRVSGELLPVAQLRFGPEDTEKMLKSIVQPERWNVFLERQTIDLAYAHKEDARFRVNGYRVQGAAALAMRLIPNKIRSFNELNLPSILDVFTQREQGFFLVVGPVGQGKSTTLAAMIDRINESRAEHILTIEDPIEYLFKPKKSLIHQREVRIDATDFHTALYSALREDVDVVMVGEMRDYETISAAVTAAETGHLVFSTLHTNNAAQTIDRIIDMFPAEQQEQVRVQLAGSLAGILSQRLVPRVSGGLIPAYEILINNNAVSSLIRDARTHEIDAIIQTSSQDGMMDMDRVLADLVRRGEVTVEHAYQHAMDPKTFERYL